MASGGKRYGKWWQTLWPEDVMLLVDDTDLFGITAGPIIGPE